MIVEIGERTLADMSEDELIDFVYKEGFCASYQYWDRPVITYFDYDKKEDTIYFDFYQIRFSDNIRHDTKAHIHISGCEKFNSPVLYSDRHSSKFFTIKEINYFLKRGFKIDIQGILTHSELPINL